MRAAMRAMAMAGVLAIGGAAAAQDDPDERPLLPKGAAALLAHDLRDGKEPIDAYVWADLSTMKKWLRDTLTSVGGSDEDRQLGEWQQDLEERRQLIKMRPRTPVRVLEWAIFVVDTPEHRVELAAIEAIRDPAAKARELYRLSEKVYRVEVTAGNFRGRKGWVDAEDVRRAAPARRR